jgi:hypothetical protein
MNRVHGRCDLKAVWVGDREFAASNDIVDNWRMDANGPLVVVPEDSTPVTAPRPRYHLITASGIAVLISLLFARHGILEVFDRVMAGLGSACHQFKVGMLLQNADVLRAATYFRRAADGGHAKAQLQYAICLSDGVGVEETATEAARYYKMLADQGNSDGQ